MTVKTKLLIIDDDRNFQRAVEKFFDGSSFEVHGAHTLAEGLHHIAHNAVDILLLDQKLPDGEGHLVIPKILGIAEKIKIILCTAFPDVSVAVDSMKLGAFDYLSKPIDLDELEITLEKARKVKDLESIAQVQSWHEQQERQKSSLVGLKSGLAGISMHLEAAIRSDATVLITGKSGTGKSVIAKHIHYQGNRAQHPIISINCSALSPSLIEAELFGYVKGAFTGAVQKRRGVFELANGGTLFLDEIGTMPLDLQTKLLGVLEEGVVRRVGSEQFLPVDVRIIAATNADLEEEVEQQRFRADLFYRLNVVRIHVPPLRDRIDDLPGLISMLLTRIMPGGIPPEPSPEEIRRLQCYPWPGNIRELRNILERAILIQRDGPFQPSRFLPPPPDSRDAVNVSTPPSASPLPPTTPDGLVSLEEFSLRYIKTAYDLLGGNISKTSRVLEVSESTLRRKLKS